MEITRKSITIRELCEGYVNESETQIEDAVKAYGGKLCVRPAFQRAFVYDKKQENAVIDTAMKGFPLNIMWIMVMGLMIVSMASREPSAFVTLWMKFPVLKLLGLIVVRKITFILSSVLILICTSAL